MSAMLKVVEKEGMENKTKALDAALAQIERAFGKGSIMKLGQREGLDIEALMRHRADTGSVVDFAGAEAIDKREAMFLECEVLLPAATET